MNEFTQRLNQPLLQQITAFLPPEISVYLVGGAVRDAFLNRQSYDLDFVTAGDAMKMARQLADNLGGAYYPLDPQRKVARVVLKADSRYTGVRPDQIRVDFSAFQGEDLLHDLQGRDFTINAMAVEIHRLDSLVDPLSGAVDLVARRLRACTSHSFIDDPIRILRAVRFSVDLELKIQTDTLHWMQAATAKLPQVSLERIRDEFFRILVNQHPATALRILGQFGALAYVVPEVTRLQEVQQSTPHVWDAWNHTLKVLDQLESLLDVLQEGYNPGKADNLIMGLVAIQLGRFRKQLAEHLHNALNPDRPHRGLLFLAGLFHDLGKAATQTVDDDGRIRFIGHEQVGSQMARTRAQELRLSNLEIMRLVSIVSHHMRPSLLSHTETLPSRKAVYHFFRDTGAAGVDICILSLADMLATYGPSLPQERWARHLEVVRMLLEAWWEQNQERIFPPAVIDGDDLMGALDLPPGPLVGFLLESIREAQINHEVSDRSAALQLARKLLLENT